MLQSMTGYGKATCELRQRNITIEMKSLNSKQFDCYLRQPHYLKEKEIEIRNLLAEKLIRGKIELFISEDNLQDASSAKININILKSYIQQLKTGLEELQIPVNYDQILTAVLRFPDILSAEENSLSKEEWEIILKAVNKAIDETITFRKQEGKTLENEMIQRIKIIENLLLEVEPYEKSRIVTIKQRIRKNLEELSEEAISTDRFEQEMIYYIEKLDITEEKVRLKKHCEYFIETIEDTENEFSVGKKLNFITQEIGREINTLGSKASDAEIQRLVVQMKDELEKIKEQGMNIV